MKSWISNLRNIYYFAYLCTYSHLNRFITIFSLSSNSFVTSIDLNQQIGFFDKIDHINCMFPTEKSYTIPVSDKINIELSLNINQ